MDRKHQRFGTQVVELALLSTKVPGGWHTLGPDLSAWLGQTYVAGCKGQP
jgi:hypothetical protein